MAMSRARIILTSTGLYAFLVVLLFTAPRYAGQRMQDGLSQIAAAMGVAIIVGGTAFMTSILVCCITIRWSNEIPVYTHLIGFLPIICTTVICTVTSYVLVLQQQAQNNESDEDQYWHEDNRPVPISKFDLLSNSERDIWTIYAP
mmetsp:Transcript_14288/g.22317  ORF Transcript_14288/g.22317 Transcript_14288/m.22317 type:complete len:145 (-) Transcript_14288:303-737(-)